MTELIPLDTGFATIGQGAGPMMVTWKAGLFHKHGLAVERPRIMGGAKGVVRGLMLGDIQFGNLAAPAALRANLKGEADLVFLTGGINQQFLLGGPGITNRQQLAGRRIGFVGDGGLNFRKQFSAPGVETNGRGDLYVFEDSHESPDPVLPP